DGVPEKAPAAEPVRRGVFFAEAGGYDRTGSPRHTASASRLPPGVGGGELRRVRRAGRDRGPVLDGPRRATPPRIPGRRHCDTSPRLSRHPEIHGPRAPPSSPPPWRV